MKLNPSNALFLCLLCLFVAACAVESPLEPVPTPVVDDANESPEWIVYSPDAEGALEWVRDAGAEVLASGDGLIRVRAQAGFERQIAAYKRPGRRIFVERNDQVLLADPSEGEMVYWENWSGETVADQDALASLDLPLIHGTTTGAGVKVAVIDTGIDPSHPHLAGRYEWIDDSALGSPAEAANGIDDDGDGVIDESYGHGTHVAGLVLSVAPDAIIVPFKMFGEDGQATEYELALALQQVLIRDVQVVNLSLRLQGTSSIVSSLLDQIHAQGKIVIAAAGNTGGAPSYPATHSTVLAVAATDEHDHLAPFSCFGPVEVGASGMGVLSSVPGGGTGAGSGTSMACAVASGAVALLVESSSADPVGELRSSAVHLTPANATLDGRIDPAGALGLR